MTESHWSVPDAAMDPGLALRPGGLSEDDKEMILNSYVGTEASCRVLVQYLTTSLADEALDDSSPTAQQKVETLVVDALGNLVRTKFSIRMMDAGFVHDEDGLRGTIDAMISSQVLRPIWKGLLQEHADQVRVSPALSYAKKMLDLRSDPQILPGISELLRRPGLLLQSVIESLQDKEVIAELVASVPYAGHDPHPPLLPPVLYSIIKAGDEQVFFVAQRLLLDAAQKHPPDSSPAQLLTTVAHAMRTTAAKEHGEEWAVRSAIFVEVAARQSVTVPSPRVLRALVKLVARGAGEMTEELVGNVEIAASHISKEILAVSEILQGLIRASFEPRRLDPFDSSLREPVAKMLARGALAHSDANHGGLERSILEFGSLLERLEPGCARFQVQQNYNSICKFIQEPVLALGSLYWVRDGLVKNPEESELCRASGVQVVTDGYLDMLERISKLHPQLSGDALGVIWAAFLHDYSTLSTTQRNALKLEYLAWCIRLCRYGSAVDLIKRFETVAPAADRSIIRNFFEGLLRLAGPPYSRGFIAGVSRLCKLGNVESTLSLDNAEECRRLLRRFCQDCIDGQPNEGIPSHLMRICKYQHREETHADVAREGP